MIGVAIPIPDPYGPELRRWRLSFGDAPAAAIPTHITLLPPTEVVAARLPDIGAHLAAVAARHPAFHIRLRGTATFRPVSPVVFVVLAGGTAECERVEHDVRSGPLARELRFPYHPHVTVAHDLSDDVLDRAFNELAGYDAAFRACGFSLYEHGDDGIWYRRRDFSFGGDPPSAGPA